MCPPGNLERSRRRSQPTPDSGQRGVVLRFGKFTELTQPGPRWHLPYPIESAEVVNVAGVRSVEIGYRNNVKSKVLKESLMLTDDENIVDVQFAVQYILKSPTDYLFKNRAPDDTVLQAAETAIAMVARVWSRPISDHQRLVGASRRSSPAMARSIARSRPCRKGVGSVVAASAGLTAGLALVRAVPSAARSDSTAGLRGARSRQRRRWPVGSATCVSRPDAR